MTQGTLPDVLISDDFQRTIWDENLKAAEHYNEPGRFTAVIGYEWTSTPSGRNLHRNVLYRDGADYARQMLPFTAAQSLNPEDLWKWMAAYEKKTGGSVLTLAHNGNWSNGMMFPVETQPATGKPAHGRLHEGTHPLGAALRGDPDQGRRRNPRLLLTDG